VANELKTRGIQGFTRHGHMAQYTT
jgi:hypothetical protein